MLMRNTLLRHFSHGALLMWAVSLVKADIVSVGGSAQIENMPPRVAADAFESNTTIAVFYELQNVALSTPLDVNATQPKVYEEGSGNTSGTIDAGTEVNSYLIHFDKVGGSGTFLHLSGSVTVDEPILGLISETGTLESS